MGPIKSLWASVQGDPVFMHEVNGWLAIFWIVMIPVSVSKTDIEPDGAIS